MIGERHAGELQATEAGPVRGERRGGADRRLGRRRQIDQPAPEERRVGFDRRTLRERRGMSHRKGGASLIPQWAEHALRLETGPEDSRALVGRLRQLVHLDFPDAEAERHWGAVARHRRNMSDRVGRDPGDEVAILDYFLNISPRLKHPVIIESSTLADLERDALTDPLTRLFNRRSLEWSLQRELARYRRHGVTSSLVLIDVDAFKAVNDRFGHSTGDAALRALGELMCRHLRAVDIPCRYGGDEFGVVLPDTDPSHALLVAERIRGDAHAHFAEEPVAGHRIALTVSLGVAMCGHQCARLDAVLRAADRALYDAKAGGGNRVVVATGHAATRPQPPRSS